MVLMNRRGFLVTSAVGALGTGVYLANKALSYDPIKDADKLMGFLYKNGREIGTVENNMSTMTTRKLSLEVEGTETDIRWVAFRFYPSDKPALERKYEDILQIEKGNELYAIKIEGDADLRRVAPDLNIREVQHPIIRDETYTIFSGAVRVPQTQPREATLRNGRKLMQDLVSRLNL